VHGKVVQKSVRSCLLALIETQEMHAFRIFYNLKGGPIPNHVLAGGIASRELQDRGIVAQTQGKVAPSKICII
jgi:hypothetical protein